jgi:glycerol uptake facilitator-like aquaporin
MATKKASSSKVASKKRSSTKKPAKPATTVVQAAAKTGGKKLTFGEKVAALRPGVLIAEFLGTLVLAGAVISTFDGGTAGSIAVALILAVLVIVFGVVSGAHLNPAITIAQYVNRKIDGVKAFAYIVSQVFGALAAFGLLLGLFTASSPSLESRVYDALTGNGYVSAEEIDNGGGITKYLDEVYEMTVKDAAEELGVNEETEFVDQQMTADHEWTDFLLEMLGAIIFGLGVGYAVYAERKGPIATGLAVGVAWLAGILIGGATVILNPAVAAAIGGFEAVNPFGVDAMTFWWPVFTYIGATVIGMTAGFTIYRFILKDATSKQ